MTIHHKKKARKRVVHQKKKEEQGTSETSRAPRMHKCLQAYLDTFRENSCHKEDIS